MADVRTVELSSGIRIAYESLGNEQHPCILLIMGLGAQMVLWPDAFCEMLVERGFRVVRFDNRDVGLSTRLTDAPTPRRRELIAGWLRGGLQPAYTLDDMVEDTIGLLDHLQVEQTHVVGASMGGAIAQTLTINHPNRVLSLTSIMSTPGTNGHGRPKLRALKSLLQKRPTSRAETIASMLKTYRTIGSQSHPIKLEEIAPIANTVWERGLIGRGFFRQLAAMLSAPDRTDALQQLSLPAAVIHGEQDPLIPPSGGQATARALPGATWHRFGSMGHDLPAHLWPEIVDIIATTSQ